MKHKTWRISTALLLSITILVLVTSLGSGFFIYSMVRSMLISGGIHDVVTVAHTATQQLAKERHQRPGRSPVEDLSDLATGHLYLLLVDAHGHFVVSSGSMPPTSPSVGWTNVPSQGWISDQGIPYVFAKLPIVLGVRKEYLIIVNPLDRSAALLKMLKTVLGLGGLLLFISSVIGVMIMIRQLTEPLRALKDAAENVTLSSRIDEPISIPSKLAEVSSLSLSLNQMLTRLYQAQERERQFLSNAAHALRTPIHLIKGYARTLSQWGHHDPGVREEALKALVRESTAMDILVNRLLQMSRMEGGEPPRQLQPLDLRTFLSEILPDLRDTCLHHPLSIHTPHHTSLMVTSDHELLHTVLRILVENADEYANQESVVTVEVKEIEEYIQIAVKNHGPRIPQEMLGHLFERFYRANQPASSHHSGLGLAIAHLIVGILHGEWSVTSQDEETVFAIKFPKA